MTFFPVFEPARTGQDICSVNGFHTILHFHAYHQHDFGSLCKNAFYPCHQCQSAGSTGAFHTDSRLASQAFINIREEGSHVGLLVEPGSYEITDDTFVYILRSPDHLQGSLPGFFDVFLEPGTFFFRIEFLAAGTH